MPAQDLIAQLQAPFPARVVKWRVGRRDGDRLGQAIPYIDARDVQERLDEVVGAGKWEVTMRPNSMGIVSGIRILIDGNWVLKEDGSHFDNFSSNNPAAKELAIKGAYSAAFKRAAVMWGIGRYLHAYKAEFVALDTFGQFVEAPSLPAHLLPAVAEPEPAAVPEATARDARPPDLTAQETASEPANEPAMEAAMEAANEPATGATNLPAEPTAAHAAASANEPATEPAMEAANLPAEPTRDEAVTRSKAFSFSRSPLPSTSPTGRKVTSEPVTQGLPSSTPEAREVREALSPKQAGAKTAPDFDYSHLTLTELEAIHLADVLGKIPKLPYSMLKNYVLGDKFAAKLNASARDWLVACIEAHHQKLKAA